MFQRHRVVPATLCVLAVALACGASASAASERSPQGGVKGCIDEAQVTQAGDDGVGSLRHAVPVPCPGGQITFAERFDIALASEIAIDKAVNIDAGSVSGEADVDAEAILTLLH